MNPKRQIFITFQKAGIHCYPEAGTNPELAEVSYLASPHRHIFHFKVYIDIKHDNREIEFIMFKNWIESLYSEGTLSLNSKSCEMMTDDLYFKIAEKYPGRNVTIEVSEDGENGAVMTVETERIPFTGILSQGA